MDKRIEVEETRLEEFQAEKNKAEAVESEAKQALIDAKMKGESDAKQRKLLQALVAAQADAGAAASVVEQQEQILEGVRKKVAQEAYDAALDDVENAMAAARQSYRDHHDRLAQHLRSVAKEWEYLAKARRDEQIACERYSAIENGTGKSDVFAAMTMRRIPGLGQLQAQFAQFITPAAVERMVKVTRAR